MSRLEILKKEREEIKRMRCLSFALKDECLAWYDKEIEVIEMFKEELNKR